MAAVKVALPPRTHTKVGEEFSKADTLPERNALRSGLPSKDDISVKLKTLAAKITLKDCSKGDFVDTKDFVFKAGKGVIYSEALHHKFQNEFAKDVEEIFTRIQRVKLRAMAYDLRGAHYHEEPKGAPYSWDEHFPVAKYSSLASKHTWKKEPLTPKEIRELVQGLNALMGGRFVVSPSDLMNSNDAELCEKVASSMRYGNGLNDEDRARLQPIINRIVGLESEIREMKNAPLLFSLDDNSDSQYERVLKGCWQEYRAIVKDFAAFEELGSWYSPSYAQSVTPQCGPRQRPEAFRTDYQRWAMEELKVLEPKLHKACFRSTDYNERAENLIVGGGLNALQAIFNVLQSDFERAKRYRIRAYDNKERPAPSVFKTKRIYFEVDQAIETFCEACGIKPVEFEPQDTEQLITRIKEDHPNAVFLNPMSNMFEMEVTRVSKIFAALSSDSWRRSVGDFFYTNGGLVGRHLYLVIDNTTLGKAMKWKNFDFRKLPSFVRVVSFESLVKYGQDGLDLAPAGLITVIGEYGMSEFKGVRQRCGFMPTESTVRRLEPSVDGDALDRKMARHSRNTLLLAESVENLATPNGFIARAIHPLLSSHPQNDIAATELEGAAGLFNIGINFEFLRDYRERHESRGHIWDANPISKHDWGQKARQITKAFTELCTLLARSVNLELNQGTSYGFNITRLAVYEHLLDSKIEPDYDFRIFPFIRVAAGTENIKDVKLLSAVFRRANEIFTSAIRGGRILDLTEKLVGHKIDVEFA